MASSCHEANIRGGEKTFSSSSNICLVAGGSKEWGGRSNDLSTHHNRVADPNSFHPDLDPDPAF
jgi:hypothetical protein